MEPYDCLNGLVGFLEDKKMLAHLHRDLQWISKSSTKDKTKLTAKLGVMESVFGKDDTKVHVARLFVYSGVVQLVWKFTASAITKIGVDSIVSPSTVDSAMALLVFGQVCIHVPSSEN